MYETCSASTRKSTSTVDDALLLFCLEVGDPREVLDGSIATSMGSMEMNRKGKLDIGVNSVRARKIICCHCHYRHHMSSFFV